MPQWGAAMPGGVTPQPRCDEGKNNPSNTQNKKYKNEAKGGLYQASESPSETGLSPFRESEGAYCRGVRRGLEKSNFKRISSIVSYIEKWDGTRVVNPLIAADDPGGSVNDG